MPALDALDAFLASLAQRDLSRALLASAFGAHGLVLVAGDATGATAARLVTTLAKAWPTPHVHLVLLEASPTRLTSLLDGEGEPRVLEGRAVADALRAALRQDPDVIALPSLAAADAPLALAAAQTGHGLLLGSAAPSAEALLERLGGSEAAPFVAVVVELGPAGDGRVVLQRVLRRVDDRLEVLAAADGDGVTLHRARLPSQEVAPPPPPRWAPPLSSRPSPTVAPRRAFLPATAAEGGTTRHTLGASTALRPRGKPWPRCRACEAPLQLVVQLDLAELPDALELPVRAGLAQLFVCTEGCDTSSEAAPGVVAEVLTQARLSRVTSPGHEGHVAVAPGAIVSWRGFDDGRASDTGDWPLRADKLGGWPAWEQGDEWPGEADGSPMALLFQFVEGEVREGGAPPTWSFEEARVIPGTPATRRLDPELPRHFPALLTADAVGFLFLSREGRLVFRWQTG